MYPYFFYIIYNILLLYFLWEKFLFRRNIIVIHIEGLDITHVYVHTTHKKW